MPEVERRKHYRSKDTVVVVIDGKEHKTKNLSESGAMFYADEDYEKDRIYNAIISIKNIDVKAKLHFAYRNPQSSGKKYRYGIEFLYDKGDERKVIQKFIYSRGYTDGEKRRGQFGRTKFIKKENDKPKEEETEKDNIVTSKMKSMFD